MKLYKKIDLYKYSAGAYKYICSTNYYKTYREAKQAFMRAEDCKQYMVKAYFAK